MSCCCYACISYVACLDSVHWPWCACSCCCLAKLQYRCGCVRCTFIHAAFDGSASQDTTVWGTNSQPASPYGACLNTQYVTMRAMLPAVLLCVLQASCQARRTWQPAWLAGASCLAASTAPWPPGRPTRQPAWQPGPQSLQRSQQRLPVTQQAVSRRQGHCSKLQQELPWPRGLCRSCRQAHLVAVAPHAAVTGPRWRQLHQTAYGTTTGSFRRRREQQQR